jgi:hypothetical protein
MGRDRFLHSALLAIALAFPTWGSTAEAARMRPESLKFTVVRSDDNQPVADAKVDVKMYGDGSNINKVLTTNAAGEVAFEYPDGDKPVYLWAMIKRPGLVPYYVNFGRGLIPEALPTTKTIRLVQGKKVGGMVVDAQGKPVAGVQVSITTPGIDTPSEIHYHLLYEKTGEDGKWSLDGAPLNSDQLHVSLEHPQFIRTWAPMQDRVDGRYELDPGLTLSGRVLDEQGKPIPKAHITVGRDRWGRSEKPTPVDKEGRFTVYALKPETTPVTAEAPGFAPQIVTATVESDGKPVEFSLKKGFTTRFQLVNADGDPIVGARIVADTWNKHRSLWWDARTDAQGEALWDGAPEEPVEFHILHKDYAAVRDAVLSPGDSPQVVTLLKPLRIEGLVTDGDDKNVAEFKVLLGRKYPWDQQQQIHWDGNVGTAGRNGKFELIYNETCEEVFIRIEAKGFQTWTSEAIPFHVTPQKLTVSLKANS